MADRRLQRWLRWRRLGRNRFALQYALPAGLFAFGAFFAGLPASNPPSYRTRDVVAIAAAVTTFGFVVGFLVGLWRWNRGEQLIRNPPICMNCGYSLTGNLSGRCSECGQESSEIN